MDKLIRQLMTDNEFYYSEIHGRSHYANVMAAGLELAQHYHVNPKILKYFAYLHDSCRENENYDPWHGPRAADYVAKNKHLIDLGPDELVELQSACYYHTSAKPWDNTTYSIVEQICFDADRSDIGRIGVEVDPLYLFTSRARELFINDKPKFRSACA
jgi:uncharacterized protein